MFSGCSVHRWYRGNPSGAVSASAASPASRSSSATCSSVVLVGIWSTILRIWGRFASERYSAVVGSCAVRASTCARSAYDVSFGKRTADVACAACAIIGPIVHPCSFCVSLAGSVSTHLDEAGIDQELHHERRSTALCGHSSRWMIWASVRDPARTSKHRPSTAWEHGRVGKRADVEVGSLYVSCANPRFYGSVIVCAEQPQARRSLGGGLQCGR